MQPLHHEPPTALMRGLAASLHAAPPPGRWSAGGVFLADLADRYVTLAERLRRHGELDAMNPERHADWFSRLAVDPLPTASVMRIFTDLQLWGADPLLFDELCRDVLAERVHRCTVAFVETVGRHS